MAAKKAKKATKKKARPGEVAYLALRVNKEKKARIWAAAAKVSEDVGVRIPPSTWALAQVMKAVDQVLGKGRK